MPALQEQAARMLRRLSDEDTIFVMEIIRRLMVRDDDEQELTQAERDGAFRRLESARLELKQFLPENYDPEAKLEEARRERYGSIG